MSREIVMAVKALAKERKIDPEILFTAIEEGLVSAYRREFDVKSTENIRERIFAEIDRETGEMRVFFNKEVVEVVTDEHTQISLAEAREYDEEFEIGELIEFEVSPQDFGRLAAQTARSVITHKLNEAESKRVFEEFSQLVNTVVTGTVKRRERRDVYVEVNGVEALLRGSEQVRNDNYNFNVRMRFFVLNVSEHRGRPLIELSRKSPGLVIHLFEQEVPEIASGVVQITGIAREAGMRTKMSVISNDENVDPLGACVGQRGMRVQAIIEELRGEKIDIINWHPDVALFISNALSPARVRRVDLNPEAMAARVIVPDDQLSLAIGREGQNARLAARLTGWKIDIKSDTQFNQSLQEEIMEHFVITPEEDLEPESDGLADETAVEDPDAPIDFSEYLSSFMQPDVGDRYQDIEHGGGKTEE